MMKKYLLLLVGAVIVFSCHHKKNAAEGDETMDVHAFVDLFKTVKLPYEFTDTILLPHREDSLLQYKTVVQFVPDSVFTRHFGKSARPRLYSLGKVSVRKHETYLFMKALNGSRGVVLVLCFDKSAKFVASLPLINTGGESDIKWIAGMDNKYTISVTRQRKSPNGQLLYRRWAYVFNDAGVFTLILTESNEARPKSARLFNPIDSLPHKHKFSGDYIQDKRDLISIRDAKNPAYALIFVHFEKDGGACKGELKGQAKFISANAAQYRSNSDPCVVNFSFSASGVRMKEIEGCGNHRDIKCFFDGFYTKKKEIKSRPAKKKLSNHR